MSDMRLSADERVARGAELFDTYNAGGWDWRADINQGELDVEDYSHCPIGQVFPNTLFAEALERIGCNNPYECGFMPYDDRDDRAELNAAWLREING